MPKPIRRAERRNLRSHHPYQKIVSEKPAKPPSISGLMMDGAHPHLWLTQENIDLSFQQLVQSIQYRRQSLKELSIYHLYSKFTEQEFSYLYDTIARLPKLQKFSLWTRQPLDLPVFTIFLQKAQSLEAVSFQSVELKSWKDMAYFANALLHHPSLTKVCLDQVQITAPGLTLDPLLHAIARNPRITSLRISTEEQGGSCSKDMIVDADCLIRLCTNSNLKELSLWGIELDDVIVDPFARELKGNHQLQKLNLRHCGLTHKGQESLVHLLPQLQTLQLGDGLPEDLQWWIDFYMYLNKTDTRYTLMEDDAASSSDWLEALTVHNSDVSAAFHLLQERGLQLFHS